MKRLIKKCLSLLRDFLWFSAGADLAIARNVKSELVILDSVGASVVGTMLLAGLTSAYAAFFIFNDELKALVFGCLWAILIYNLDRYSVASIRKKESLIKDCIVALPRMLLALIIAVVIVVPLELRIFEAEIDEKLGEYYVSQAKSYEFTVEESHLGNTVLLRVKELKTIEKELQLLEELRQKALLEPEVVQLTEKINVCDKKISILREEITEAQNDKARLESESIKEEDGLGESGIRGRGPHWRALQAGIAAQEKIINSKTDYLNDIKIQQEGFKQELSKFTYDERIDQLKEKRYRAEQEVENATKLKDENIRSHFNDFTSGRSASLLTRLKISHQLAEDPTVDWTVTLLRLLIIIFELSPIFLKLISEKIPYDAWRNATALLEIEKADKKGNPSQEKIIFFVLEHAYTRNGDHKLEREIIGVYSKKDNAVKDIKKLSGLPGFRDYYDYFCIMEYEVDSFFQENNRLIEVYEPKYSIWCKDDVKPDQLVKDNLTKDQAEKELQDFNDQGRHQSHYVVRNFLI